MSLQLFQLKQIQLDYPEKMEHFGISTGEAMAGGAVPVVINAGGQPEVLGKNLEKWLWKDMDSCLEKTLELMNNESKRNEWSLKSAQQVHNFDQEHFEKNIDKMMNQLGLKKI